MKQMILSGSILAISLVTIIIFFGFTPLTTAQEEVCMHDPYPSEAMSIEVDCDDPSCNVGPCVDTEKSQCWRNPTLENPGSYEQNYRVRCDSPECNEGPCTKTRQTPQERIQQREENGEQRGALLQERVQDRIINLAANVVSRLGSIINRFENIIERLDSRIDKLEALGVDTVDAELKLAEAKGKLSSASDLLDGLSSVQEAVTSDGPREAFNVVKSEIKSIRDLLRGLHVDLREVVSLLKKAVREAELGRGVSDVVSNRAEDLRSDDTEDAEDMRSGTDPEKYLPTSN